MARRNNEINRTRTAPDLQFVEGQRTYSIYVLNDGDRFDWRGDDRHVFMGPSIVRVASGPDMGTESVEYDIDSPKFWAYLSRVIHIGYFTGKVTSAKDETTAPANRDRTKPKAKV